MTVLDLCQAYKLWAVNKKKSSVKLLRKNLWPHRCCHNSVIIGN